MSNVALQRKVQKLLSSRVRVDSPEMVQALKGLSNLFPDSSGEEILVNRQKLRSLLEQHGVQSNRELVESFGEVQTQLASLDGAISELTTACSSITQRLQDAREGTANLLSKTSSLQQEQEDLGRKAEITATFLQRFQLSAEELRALEGDEVNDQFFDSLRRIGEIRSDCKGLLQNYHQRVGLDIMDSLAQRLEKGYEKLYRWVQQESRDLQHHSEVRSSFARALRMLKAMPVYYRHCCQEIAQTRRLLVIRRFLAALTRGGDGARPIELNAHDPGRYVGDMCAWAHQATASEMDFFATVLCLTQDKQDERAEVCTLVTEVMGGVSRPLKARITQCITSHGTGTPTAAAQRDGVTLYKLSNILDFYTESIGILLLPAKTGSSEASANAGSDDSTNLDVVLEEMARQAREMFFMVMDEEAQRLNSNPPAPPRDLSPPRSVLQATEQLSRLLELTSASLTSYEEHAIEKLMSASVDPILSAIDKGARDLGPSDKAVYMINVWEHLQECLRKCKNSITFTRGEVISLQIQQSTDELIASQVAIVLSKCGLDDKIAKIFENSNNSKLADIPGMGVASLSPVLQSFYSMTLSLSALPHCDRILNALIRRSARQAIAVGICDKYQSFYSAVMDSASGYPPELASVLVHSPQQINTLLDVNDSSRITSN